MPLNIDDTDNSAITGNPSNLRRVLNGFAFQIKQITGQTSWKVPPDLPITQLGEKGDKGDTGATGAQGIQGEKGEKGDPGEPAPLDHQHAIAQVEGLQTALDGKSPAGHQHAIADVSGLQTALNNAATGIITSATQPNNPSQGLIWNELDSNNNLIETWTYTNTSWISPLKNLSLGISTISGSTQNVRTNFCFNRDCNIFIKKWTVNLQSQVAVSNTNRLDCFLLKNLSTTVTQFSINSLAANTYYYNSIDINQLFTFANPNFNLFEFRIFVSASPVSFYAASNISYNLVRK